MLQPDYIGSFNSQYEYNLECISLIFLYLFKSNVLDFVFIEFKNISTLSCIPAKAKTGNFAGID